MSSEQSKYSKNQQKQASSFSDNLEEGMFEPRPFVVQSKQDKVQQLDLKASLIQAKHYGHHLNQIDSASVSNLEALQPKMEVGRLIQLAPKKKKTPTSQPANTQNTNTPTGTSQPANKQNTNPPTGTSQPANKQNQNSSTGTNQPANTQNQNPSTGTNQPANTHNSNPSTGTNQPANTQNQNPATSTNQPANTQNQNPATSTNQPANTQNQNPATSTNQPANTQNQNPATSTNQPANTQNQNPATSTNQPANTQNQNPATSTNQPANTQNQNPATSTNQPANTQNQNPAINLTQANALTSGGFVPQKGGKLKPGQRAGGFPFGNKQNMLPQTDSAGKPITYTEYDVNSKTGKNRDAERIVKGSDGRMWHTVDHYASFNQVT